MMNIVELVAKLLFLIAVFYALIFLFAINSWRKSNNALEENVNKVLHTYEIKNINYEMLSFRCF